MLVKKIIKLSVLRKKLLSQKYKFCIASHCKCTNKNGSICIIRVLKHPISNTVICHIISSDKDSLCLWKCK